MFIKFKKILFILTICFISMFLTSCYKSNYYYFKEGLYKCESVELIINEETTVTGVSLEFKKIDTVESDINTIKNYKDKKEYEVKLIFMINNEEVQCNFTNKKRGSCRHDSYCIEGDVSKIFNMPNTTLDFTLDLTRIDISDNTKGKNATRIIFSTEFYYEVEDRINNMTTNYISFDLDYVNDKSDKIEV